jgi:chromosome segregation ATPase
MRLKLESEGQTEEALQRRLRLLREEEAGLSESVHKLQRLVSELKHVVLTAQADCEAAQTRARAEQRAISDLKANRDVLESEVLRLSTEHNTTKERATEEAQRVFSYEGNVERLRSELAESQRALHSARRLCEDANRELDMTKIRENELKATVESLNSELCGLQIQAKEERKVLDSVRLELRKGENELSALKEQTASLQAERMSWCTAIESLKAQHVLNETMKESLEAEIGQLRETARREGSKARQLQLNAEEIGEHIKDLKHKHQRTEIACEETQRQREEEETRMHEQQLQLKKSTEHLNRIDTQIEEANYKLEAERVRAIEEISALNSAKNHAQSKLIMAATAKQRLMSAGPLSPDVHTGWSGGRAHTPTLLRKEPVVVGGELPRPFVSHVVPGVNVFPSASSSSSGGASLSAADKYQLSSEVVARNDFHELELEVERLREKSLSILAAKTD